MKEKGKLQLKHFFKKCLLIVLEKEGKLRKFHETQDIKKKLKNQKTKRLLACALKNLTER